MGIGINNAYSNILQNYRVPTVPSVSADQVAKQEEEQRLQVQQASGIPSSVSVSPDEEFLRSRVEKRDVPLEDLSLTFNMQEDFGHIGRDSDIRSLDVEHAIDNLQKDKMLQQYQYFVGSSQNLAGTQTPDGIVVPKF